MWQEGTSNNVMCASYKDQATPNTPYFQTPWFSPSALVGNWATLAVRFNRITQVNIYVGETMSFDGAMYRSDDFVSWFFQNRVVERLLVSKSTNAADPMGSMDLRALLIFDT